jgi:hypothetical protein
MSLLNHIMYILNHPFKHLFDCIPAVAASNNILTRLDTEF